MFATWYTSFAFFSVPVLADKQVRFATVQSIPYIADSLPQNGYLHELIVEAYKRVGYKVSIEFYPLARTQKLAKQGLVDGMLPLYFSNSLEQHFHFSAPLPGGQIGLLQRIDSKISAKIQPQGTIFENLRHHSSVRVGIVRGSLADQLSIELGGLNIVKVVDDLQNIDILNAQRVDFALIDKFTAGDLIVSQRPQYIGKLGFLHPPLKELNFHIGFSKQAKDALTKRNALNTGLIELKRDGTFTKILAKHGFYSQLPPNESQTNRTQLVIGTVDNPDMLTMREFTSEFEKRHPNIELVWRVLDEATLRERVLTDVAVSGGQFDVVTVGTFDTPILARNGWISPLKELPKNYDTSDLIKSVKRSLSVDNTLYGLPINAERSVLYYRHDLFKQNNISLPLNPTYQELVSYASQLHNPENDIYGVCLRGKPSWGESIALISTMINTYGGTWFDNDWRPQINTTPWFKALSTYISLVKNYGPPNSTSLGFNENLSLFLQGKCAMWIDASLAAGSLFDARLSQVSNKVSIAKAPINIRSTGSQWFWSWAFAISSSSSKKQAAKTFITWATSKEYIQLVADQRGVLAMPSGTRYSTYANTAFLEAAPFALSILNAIETNSGDNLPNNTLNGIQYAPIKEFPSIGNNVARLIERVILDEITLEEALLKAQEVADSQMQLSGYY